jgi:hypothetical protein
MFNLEMIGTESKWGKNWHITGFENQVWEKYFKKFRRISV